MASTTKSTTYTASAGATSLATSAINKGYEPGALIRPLGSLETFAVLSAKYQTYNTVQAAWLSSIVPIDADVVAAAIHKVTSSYELLQTCVSKQCFRLWLQKMEQHVMDFAAIDQDPVQVYNSMLTTPFDLRAGPLWKARLVQQTPSSEKNFEAVLLISIQHLVTDGTTNLLIMRDILTVLNSVARGEVVELPFRPVPETADHLVQWKSVPFRIKAASKVAGSVFLNNILGYGPYKKLTGNPGSITGSIKSLSHEFSETLTSQFVKRCKANSVTINCCLIAIARLALLKLLQTLSKDCKSVHMIVESCVNIRRYLGPEQKEVPGYFATTEGQGFVVSNSDLRDPEGFWELAHKINEKQKQHLLDEEPAKLIPMFDSLHLSAALNKWLTSQGLRNVEFCHILANSLGDLDKQYFTHAKPSHVSVSKYMRGTSSIYNPQRFTLQYHTLGGKLTLTVEQFTNMTDDSTTQLFFDYLVSFVTSVAENGVLQQDFVDVIISK